eukprot:406642-Amphidinium_carterae.1
MHVKRNCETLYATLAEHHPLYSQVRFVTRALLRSLRVAWQSSGCLWPNTGVVARAGTKARG